MTLPDDKLEQETAARALARIEKQDSFANEQVASMGKWLMASLLAANSGGVIVTVQMKAGPDLIASSLFMIGAGASLLSGTAMQEFYNAIPELLRFKERYWLKVSMGKPRCRRAERLIEARMKKTMRKAIVIPALGWLSGLLWLTGVTRIVLSA